MKITLGDAPAVSDLKLAVGDGGAISPDEVFSTGTVVCPVGTTFDTNTGLCAGTPTPRVAVCPVGVDVTGYGGEGGCACPSGYSLDSHNQCSKGGGGFSLASIPMWGWAVAGVVLFMGVMGGRRR